MFCVVTASFWNFMFFYVFLFMALSEIIKLLRCHPLGFMNVCTTFQGNKAVVISKFSPWSKVFDHALVWLTNNMFFTAALWLPHKKSQPSIHLLFINLRHQYKTSFVAKSTNLIRRTPVGFEILNLWFVVARRHAIFNAPVLGLHTHNILIVR